MTPPESRPLPPLKDQLHLLRTTGDQFTDQERAEGRRELPDVTIWRGVKSEPALYDARIVPHVLHIIAPDRTVSRALSRARPDRITTNQASSAIDGWFDEPGIIVGFSGYGTGDGYAYSTEESGINGTFDDCKELGITISRVVDGGTGYGVPGLSGVLAKERGIPTLGFVPLRGLRGIAPRNELVVVGQEFGDEAKALGATPDVLIVLGGGPNAEKEIEAALDVNSLVILASLRDYPDTSAVYANRHNPKAARAERQGDLVVCRDRAAVKEALGTACASLDADQRRQKREARKPALKAALQTAA